MKKGKLLSKFDKLDFYYFDILLSLLFILGC